MIICKSFKFRVYPSDAQIVRLGRWNDALRFLWNIALEQRRYGVHRPRDERRFPTAFDQINELTELRANVPWIADVPRNVCAQLLVELEKGWQRCFNRISDEPGWKSKKNRWLSFCETHPKVWWLKDSTLRFPKLGKMRAVVHRPLEGKPKTCTLIRDVDQWFVGIVCEVEIGEPVHRLNPVVAIDRGIVNAVGDSDGRLIPAPRFHAHALDLLARANRNVSRKKKGSKNKEKAQLRLARLHRKIRCQRQHFIHGLSHDYAKSHSVVVLEKLDVVGLTRSATRTLEAPGHNIQQKSHMNRGVLDAGWGMLARMLTYKLLWVGGSVAEEPAYYTSQTCSSCGHVDAKNRIDQSTFCCVSCDYVDHADLNAAKVLKQNYESRVNRAALPGEDTVPEAARRTRKTVGSRISTLSHRRFQPTG
jgi:putative transposase